MQTGSGQHTGSGQQTGSGQHVGGSGQQTGGAGQAGSGQQAGAGSQPRMRLISQPAETGPALRKVANVTTRVQRMARRIERFIIVSEGVAKVKSRQIRHVNSVSSLTILTHPNYQARGKQASNPWQFRLIG
ncbi:hypothetical protein RRSWK_05088 [Rhodopirellula sp. SWK7]|nr:hypothetical protein RRSWK_05088 [Rhodopirellula sp. SWK7]